MVSGTVRTAILRMGWDKMDAAQLEAKIKQVEEDLGKGLTDIETKIGQWELEDKAAEIEKEVKAAFAKTEAAAKKTYLEIAREFGKAYMVPLVGLLGYVMATVASLYLMLLGLDVSIGGTITLHAGALSIFTTVCVAIAFILLAVFMPKVVKKLVADTKAAK